MNEWMNEWMNGIFIAQSGFFFAQLGFKNVSKHKQQQPQQHTTHNQLKNNMKNVVSEVQTSSASSKCQFQTMDQSLLSSWMFCRTKDSLVLTIQRDNVMQWSSRV